MKSPVHYLEQFALAVWDRCVQAVEKDGRARAATLVRQSDPLLEISIPKERTYIAFGVIVFVFLLLWVRVFWLQVVSNEFLQDQGEQRFARTIPIEGVRGDILDRNGVVLATSQPCRSIWADPRLVDRKDVERLKKLAKLLNIPYRDLDRKLKKNAAKAFVYLARDMDTDDVLPA